MSTDLFSNLFDLLIEPFQMFNDPRFDSTTPRGKLKNNYLDIVVSGSKRLRLSDLLIEFHHLVTFSRLAFIKFADLKEIHGLLG